MATPRKVGGKNRKLGRSSRKPAHIRYIMANRSETNKERRRLRHLKRVTKKAQKLLSAKRVYRFLES